MTNEKVLEYLQDCPAKLHCADGKVNHCTGCNVREALDKASKAVEKQIPKKFILEHGFVKCPACSQYIRLPIADHYNNCPECGQAIEWNDD